MSLMTMGDASESVRFLDDTDLTLTFDSRATSSQQMTNIEIMVKPIVLRASYRDINLVMSIANNVVGRYGRLSTDSNCTRNRNELLIPTGRWLRKIDVATTQATSSGNT
jgi:vacuolar protein sorting-associated protein 13A/C